MLTTDQVKTLLKNVIDPEIGINIVDLGLVYGVNSSEEAIEITMTLTTPGCPMHNSIMSWIENLMAPYAPEGRVRINLVWEPAWTPACIDPSVREELGL
jgi:metal-sulfur cluster biosynthetic enzyme